MKPSEKNNGLEENDGEIEVIGVPLEEEVDLHGKGRRGPDNVPKAAKVLVCGYVSCVVLCCRFYM